MQFLRLPEGKNIWKKSRTSVFRKCIDWKKFRTCSSIHKKVTSISLKYCRQSVILTILSGCTLYYFKLKQLHMLNFIFVRLFEHTISKIWRELYSRVYIRYKNSKRYLGIAPFKEVFPAKKKKSNVHPNISLCHKEKYRSTEWVGFVYWMVRTIIVLSYSLI